VDQPRVTTERGDVAVFEQVTVWRSTRGVRRAILDGIDWRAAAGEHWGILGPNGAGKSTLLRIASARIRPSKGSATILGGTLGRVSMPDLRRRIGVVDPALARRFYPEQTVLDVVLTGLAGSILLVDDAGRDDVTRARALLETVGAAALAAQAFVNCSEGERARVMLARALAGETELLVLDEPAAGLDLPGRELLLTALAEVGRAHPGLATLTATHHVEELPASTTNVLLLRDGRTVAAGPLAETLTGPLLSECFGIPLQVEHAGGRVFVRSG
jgi:iron complex transport system ATP-binding protein